MFTPGHFFFGSLTSPQTLGRALCRPRASGLNYNTQAVFTFFIVRVSFYVKLLMIKTFIFSVSDVIGNCIYTLISCINIKINIEVMFLY